MAESRNTQIADAILDAHLRVARVGTSTRAAVLRILRLLEEDLASTIAVTDPSTPALLRARQLVLRQVLGDDIHPLVQTRYQAIAQTTGDAATRIAVFEAQNTVALLNAVVGLDLARSEALAQTVAQAVRDQLVPSVATSQDLSATAATWWTRQAAQLEQRVFDQLNVGIVQGETLPQLVRRLRGTRARGYTDGVMEVSRRDATRLVRTQFNAVANAAQLAVYDAHPESIRAVRWLSVLDGRTSLVCIGRSNLRYTIPSHVPIGHSIPFLNGPPAHWNALGAGTRILTLEGWQRIESVKVGMFVMTHRGRWRVVMETMRKRCETGIIRIVEFDTGRRLIVTDDHPVLTVRTGWQRIENLCVGDQCFEYAKQKPQTCVEDMEIASGQGISHHGPSCLDEGGISNNIMSVSFWRRVIFSIYLNANAKTWKSKINNVNTNRILKDHFWRSTLQKIPKNTLFAFCRIFTKVVSARSLHTAHCCIVGCRIVQRHMLTTCSIMMMSFFRQSISPMFFSTWMRRFPFWCLIPSPNTSNFISDNNSMFFTPEVQAAYGNSMSTFNATNRHSFFPMLFFDYRSNQFFISQIDHEKSPMFHASTIISNAEFPYNEHVYNIAVDQDESYIAEGIVVHNCRSILTPVVRDGGPSTAETFTQFLDRRGPAFQDEVLGPSRARMYRAGSLGSLTMLLDAATGRPLTLEELGA